MLKILNFEKFILKITEKNTGKQEHGNHYINNGLG